MNSREPVDDFITVCARNMPIRLIDTYTGLILERTEILSLLKIRLGNRAEPLVIAEFLAFAVFSHRWGVRELRFTDVRGASGGIYSIIKAPRDLSGMLATDFLNGAKKLQEFCCVAAKCGFRWAWADTCCIDDHAYGEKAESINSMFRWYHSSDLTIVYLEDVEDVEKGRLPPANNLWFDDPEIQNPFTPSYPYSSATSDVVTLHDCNLKKPLRLQSMRSDTQVEPAALEAHLFDVFSHDGDHKHRRKYRRVPVWFTRGWTLQEMLASKRLRFYSKSWTLLEEASDHNVSEAEKMISISSFKYRARLVDHRTVPIWLNALGNASDILPGDIVGFKAGTSNVRERLRWAARRETQKVEDMAYCLLGIFDITLPICYGEGNRAFFRLQEELMKRTDDTSLFDWCGPRSSVSSFLARGPECFMAPILQYIAGPDLNKPSGSTFQIIVDLFAELLQVGLYDILATTREARKSTRNILDSPLLRHTIVNGELNLLLFEHQVKRGKVLKNSTPNDIYHHYELEADGLESTRVTFEVHASDLMNNPTQYYLCRVWDRQSRSVFVILLEFMEYIQSQASSLGFILFGKSKSLEDVLVKREEVLRFFERSFVVYLIRVKDGRRSRLSTVDRLVSKNSGTMLRQPVPRLIQ